MVNSVTATTARNLRQHFKHYADAISNEGETVIVTRPNRKNIVMISEAEFNSWQETNYLLATKENRASLQRGLDATHPEKSLTPEEWATLVNKNE